MTFDNLDIFAPLDDDVDDELWTPRHARKEQRKPMNNAIKFAVRFVTFTALAYAGVWLLWQFALLLNTVTTQVWK